MRPVSGDGSPSLEKKLAAANRGDAPSGPPPLAPFGLVLHHDGRWSHEGQPILNRKLREKFDRSVAYLPDESKYVVRIGHFRGQIEPEEAGFFVRSIEMGAGTLRLSDGSHEALRVETLRASPLDGALICQVKQGLTERGLPARFSHSSQADLLAAVEEDAEGFFLSLPGGRVPLPRAMVGRASEGD